METSAQQWTAQMLDGTVLSGGTGDPSVDVNVSEVNPANVQMFTVSSYTFADTVYIDAPNGIEDWYENGETFTPTFPLVYSMADGTTLTISRNSDSPGDLLYTQQ